MRSEYNPYYVKPAPQRPSIDEQYPLRGQAFPKFVVDQVTGTQYHFVQLGTDTTERALYADPNHPLTRFVYYRAWNGQMTPLYGGPFVSTESLEKNTADDRRRAH